MLHRGCGRARSRPGRVATTTACVRAHTLSERVAHFWHSMAATVRGVWCGVCVCVCVWKKGWGGGGGVGKTPFLVALSWWPVLRRHSNCCGRA